MSDSGYWVGYVITWVITFIGCWIYAIVSYGFLLGVGLGWLPSAIVATLLSFLWPILVLGVAVLAYIIFKG